MKIILLLIGLIWNRIKRITRFIGCLIYQWNIHEYLVPLMELVIPWHSHINSKHDYFRITYKSAVQYEYEDSPPDWDQSILPSLELIENTTTEYCPRCDLIWFLYTKQHHLKYLTTHIAKKINCDKKKITQISFYIDSPKYNFVVIDIHTRLIRCFPTNISEPYIFQIDRNDISILTTI